jgi:recombination protein RecR
VFALPIQELVDELGRLPGVGPRSAQRIAFYLLEADRESALRLAQAIV